jgi:hypothetical protein
MFWLLQSNSHHAVYQKCKKKFILDVHVIRKLFYMQNNFVFTLLVYSLAMVLQLQSKTDTLNLCADVLHSFLCIWETQWKCHTLKSSYWIDTRSCFRRNKQLGLEAIPSNPSLTARLINSSYTSGFCKLHLDSSVYLPCKQHNFIFLVLF